MYKKEVISSQNELNIISKNDKEITTKAKYGPSKITRIPLYIDEGLSFLVGAIIGDGHIKKSKFQISIELSNRNLIDHIAKICKNLFDREFNVLPVKLREGKKQTFTLRMDSKAIHRLLENVFEIPSGKKSHIVSIPQHILSSNKKIKIAFLRGLMATEGGKRGRGFGLSTASKKLWEDLNVIFKDLEIPILKDRWIYKKYQKEYYGIVFKSKYMPIVEWECRSGQTGCA